VVASHGFVREETDTAPLPFRLRNDAIVTSFKDPDAGGKRYYLKAPGSAEVIEFGQEEYFLCRSLDGARSCADIRREFQARFGFDCPSRDVLAFVDELNVSNLLERVEGGAGAAATQAPPPAREAADDLPHTEAGETRPGRHRLNTWFRWRMFDPSGLFDVLGRWLSPLRYAAWLMIPGVLVAGLILFHRQHEMVRDTVTLFDGRSSLGIVMLAMISLNLVGRIAQGAAAHRHGAHIDFLGIHLVFGFLPRFVIDDAQIQQLSRRGQLWSYGAELLTRLLFFVVGTIVWATYRQTGTWLSDFGLLFGQLGLFVFVMTALPLLPSDGYRWLAAYFDMPKLRMRAARLLLMLLRLRPPPAGLSGWEAWALALFAIASILSLLAIIGIAYLYLGVKLESHYRGTGVSLFLGLFTLSVLWLLTMHLSAKRVLAAQAAALTAARQRAEAPAGGGALVVPMPTRLPAQAPGPRPVGFPVSTRPAYAVRRRTNWTARLVWLGLLTGGGYVAFLPYLYEAGGDFAVLPNARTQVVARVAGELLQVDVREGDWVEEGQLLAILSDWDEVRDVAVLEAELDKAQAGLRRLLAGSKPEEVELAKREVESAAERITFNKAELDRQQSLADKGVGAGRNLEFAQSEYSKSLADLAVAKANLDVVTSGATKADIDVARAQVAALEHELEFRRAQLERTRIVAPVAGQVVTPNPELQHGRFLAVGETFAEIEDSRTARVEVMVPETDISFIRNAHRVRLKAWAFSDRIVTGEVVSVAPAAEQREYGLVVRVKTEVPNVDGFLKSQMSGYAKIEGAEMPVWEAFTRMFVRFFRIEIWSWIP